MVRFAFENTALGCCVKNTGNQTAATATAQGSGDSVLDQTGSTIDVKKWIFQE